jgi:RimJ/RimL family protein N-acetyltransferase
VRHGLGQQLSEAVVDPVELEGFVEVTRGREQKLGFLCPRVTAHVGIITHVEGLAQRLEGRIVVLDPLGPEHVDGLRAAADDERIWAWMVTRDVEEWIADALREEGRQAFAILRDGVVVGSSSYMSLAPEHLRLEIGNTWMNPSTWSTGANVEAKYLLLRHAFEVLGCRRVEFKTDALNERARGALAALPSEFEGIHRKHMLVRGGERRDSAWYAVIDDDWPKVKAALERRLNPQG